MTKYRKSGDKWGRWVKDVGSFIPRDQNDPFTELGKSKEEKLWVWEKKRGKRWAWMLADTQVEGFSRQLKLGWELRVEVWAGNTDREFVHAVATVEAMLRWPRLPAEGCSKVQAIVTFSLNMEFSRKIHKYDDASYEKRCFSLCVLPASLLRNDFFCFVIPSWKGASIMEGHSEKTYSNESF